ncbi:MAG: hypothetical protein GF403_00720 [Candidatus Coatesbacteria bacterium]|nr:hypothetical protein [Candidatus Coatesbacteria bacterium]
MRAVAPGPALARFLRMGTAGSKSGVPALLQETCQRLTPAKSWSARRDEGFFAKFSPDEVVEPD